MFTFVSRRYIKQKRIQLNGRIFYFLFTGHPSAMSTQSMSQDLRVHAEDPIIKAIIKTEDPSIEAEANEVTVGGGNTTSFSYFVLCRV